MALGRGKVAQGILMAEVEKLQADSGLSDDVGWVSEVVESVEAMEKADVLWVNIIFGWAGVKDLQREVNIISDVLILSVLQYFTLICMLVEVE